MSDRATEPRPTWSHILSAVMSALQVGALLTLSSILSHTLTPAEFGTWASATAALAMLAIVAQMGLPDLLTRETAIGKKRNSGTVWATWLGFDRMLLPSLGAAMIAAAFLLPRLPGIPWQGITIAVLLLHLPCLALIALRAGAIRGLGLGNAAHFLTSIMSSALTIAIILGLMAAGQDIGLTTAFAASLISLALPLALTQCLRDALAPSPRRSYPIAEETRRALRRASLPMAGIAGLGILNSQTDVLMLSWFDGAESAGLYQVAIQTAMVLAVIRSQLGLMITGRIAALWEARDRQGIANLSRSIAILSTSISLTGFFLSLFFGEALLEAAFGAHAGQAAATLSVVCLAWTVASFFGAPGFCLMMSGHQSITLKASAISFAINALLNPLLIPVAGVGGAAFTLILSVCFWHVYLWRQVRHRLDLDCSLLPKRLSAADKSAASESR